MFDSGVRGGKQKHIGSRFGFLNTGESENRSKESRRKNSDMGSLFGVRDRVAPFKIIKGENWYGVKQIAVESLLRHWEKGKKNVNAVTTELFSSLNSWDFVEDIDHSLAVEKFVATPGKKNGVYKGVSKGSFDSRLIPGE